MANDEESLRREMQSKAAAAAEAVYRITALTGFDRELAAGLRRRALAMLSSVAAFHWRSASRRHPAAERITANAAGTNELLSFGCAQGCIGFDQAVRISRAYDRLAECARLLAAAPPASDPGEPPRRPITPQASTRQPLNERQERILGYLREAGQAQIGQIREIMGEAYSEKTLQRDLWQLVSMGLLNRHGDNRWTTYVSLGQ